MFDKAFKFWNDIFMAIEITFYFSFQWQGDFRWLKDNIISSFSWIGLLVKPFKNCPVKNEINLHWEESVIQTKTPNNLSIMHAVSERIIFFLTWYYERVSSSDTHVQDMFL